jgi:hypothetical protein
MSHRLSPGDAAQHISRALVNRTRHLAGGHLRTAPWLKLADVAITLAGTIKKRLRVVGQAVEFVCLPMLGTPKVNY